MTIIKRSLHGLGRLLDPVTLDRLRRDAHGNPVWIDEAWQWILAAHANPEAPMPEWVDLPAMSRVTVSSPMLWRPFTTWNEHRAWREQSKPFNFILVATLDPFGYPPGADPTRFRLIAPYSSNPAEWLTERWYNLYDPNGPTYRIITDRDAPAEPDLATVKSYRQILAEHRMHPEHKFDAPEGGACRRDTRGVLHRQPVTSSGLLHLIGKEANRLDDVQAGLVGSLDQVLTDYTPASDHAFRTRVLPLLDDYSGRQLADLVGVDRRTIDRIRAGARPRPETLKAMRRLLTV